MTEHPEVVPAHQRRLAALDRLLPTVHPLPEPEPGDVALTVDGAAGIYRRQRPDPASLAATWGAADQHRLLPRVGGPDPVGAMAGLLDRWQKEVGATAPTHPDSAAVLTWPSRDTAMSRLFLERGMVPSAVIAVREPGGTPAAGKPALDGGTVRPLRADDLDQAVARWLEVIRWDAQFTSLTMRPSTAGQLRADLVEVLAHEPSWAWVAAPGGQVHGLVTVLPPEWAQAFAPFVSRHPAAYLGCLGVAPGRRGTGVGAALVQAAHEALDTAGVAATLLHYSIMNPLSAPFWHRHGYRPLWTNWEAYPAAALRPPLPRG